MVIVMDMSTGERERLFAADEEFGAYAEEVLNAEWLPPVAPRLEVVERTPEPAPSEPESLLMRLYRFVF